MRHCLSSVQPDQKPTPIDCQIFKERVASQLPDLPAASAARGAHYTDVFYNVNPFRNLLQNQPTGPKNCTTPCFLKLFPRCLSSKRGALYRRFLQRQLLSESSSEPLFWPEKHITPCFYISFRPVSAAKGRIIHRFSEVSAFMWIYLQNKTLSSPRNTSGRRCE